MTSSQVSLLLDRAIGRMELFHAPAGEAYATVGRETYRLRSEGFRRELRRLAHRFLDWAPSEASITTAIVNLEAIALFEGPERAVYIRVGEDEHGNVVLDLADAERRVAVVTPIGWEVTPESPAWFLRPPGILPLPAPTRGGGPFDLANIANFDDEGSILIAGWLLGALNPRGPFPHLFLCGEPGSGKTTVAGMLRALIDPNTAPLRAAPRDERDLLIATRGSWIVTLENVSHLDDKLSDALCRLSTGGALSTRQLYTDDAEMLFEARRPALLTAIAEVATAGDLADRVLTVALPPIPEEERREERELLAALDDARPRLLGTLLDAAASALANRDRVRSARLPRMADFATWVSAAESALGWPAGTFLRAYEANRAEAGASAIEGSTVGSYLLRLAGGGGFSGTTSELLDQLKLLAGPDATRQRWWPGTARGLASNVRKLAPALRASGVEVQFRRFGHERRRVITIRRQDIEGEPQ